MTDEMNNTGEQPPVQGGESDGAQAGDQSRAFSEGIQKRFDQLTAKNYEAQARIELLQQQLVQMGAQAAAQPREPAPEPDPYENLDPALVAVLRRQERMFQAQTQQLMQRFEASNLSSQVAQMGRDQGLPSEVVTKAATLAAAMREKGIPLNAKDALHFAAGEAYLEGRLKAGQPRTAEGQFAPMNPVLGGQNGAPAAAPMTAKALPNNFDRLDPADQLRLLQSRGVEDQEF